MVQQSFEGFIKMDWLRNKISTIGGGLLEKYLKKSPIVGQEVLWSIYLKNNVNNYRKYLKVY